MLHVESDSSQAYDSQKITPSHKLRIYTKLLKEPIVVSSSAYRSGAHPVLSVRVAAEVARSPKVGLVQRLMQECKQAFTDQDYPRAILKSLAAEELLRKYGGILAPDEESEIREQLQFLKVQYFLLSGQANEAYRVLCELSPRSRPYLWHRRMADRSGVPMAHWSRVENTLRQFVKTNRSSNAFAILGYAVAMGSDPLRAEKLCTELDYPKGANRLLFESLVRDYRYLVTSRNDRLANILPAYLAAECEVAPLFLQRGTLYLGVEGELSSLRRQEIEVRLKLEVVPVPMSVREIEEKNRLLY